jgi:CO dehydrogenase nickel-insertion accessory protein CooC1
VPPATRHLERQDLAELAVRIFREARIQGVVSVLNRVTLPATAAYLRAALDGSGAPPVATFEEDAAVAEQWLHGEPLRSRRLAEAARVLATEVAAVARQAQGAAC